jgi:spore maturation protein CgeB
MARPLYCSVDPAMYRPDPRPTTLDLGYLGTYSDDRQPALDNLLLQPALRWPEGRFAVTGAMYPKEIRWPKNVCREIHLSPRDHAAFYASQRFTLNITREAMKQAGYSPSVRLFEAGSCAVPIISDSWPGLDTFLVPGREVLIAANPDDVLRYLLDYPEETRLMLGHAARQRVLAEHTPAHRALQLEGYLEEVHDNVSTHPSRRNGRERKINGGLASGMASQLQGPGSGGETGAAAGEPPDSSRVHESAGASP